MFLSSLARQAVIIYKGWVFWLHFRERSWLLFWYLKALLHDRWQIVYLESMHQQIHFGMEMKKGRSLGIVDLAWRSSNLQTPETFDWLELLIWDPQYMLQYFDVHYIEESSEIYVAEPFVVVVVVFHLFYTAREQQGSFFFCWGKWTYVHTDTQKSKHTCTESGHTQPVCIQTNTHAPSALMKINMARGRFSPAPPAKGHTHSSFGMCVCARMFVWGGEHIGDTAARVCAPHCLFNVWKCMCIFKVGGLNLFLFPPCTLRPFLSLSLSPLPHSWSW